MVDKPDPDFERMIALTMFPVGYPVPWDWIATNVKRAQDYLMQNTTLGIPALVQTEGMAD
jgi:hypothetical protein